MSNFDIRACRVCSASPGEMGRLSRACRIRFASDWGGVPRDFRDVQHQRRVLFSKKARLRCIFLSLRQL